MAGNLENILKRGDCIPEETMLRYIEGKLSSHENHLVEKHLLECEMCADALEGLKLMQPANTQKIISDLNKKIDERLENRSAKIISFNNYYRIAAVLALFFLFGGGYLFLKNMNEEKMLAQNASSEKSVATDSVSPQLVPQINTDQKSAEPISSQPKFSLKEKNSAPESQTELTESKDVETAKEIETTKDDIVKPTNDNFVSETAKSETKESVNQGTTTKATTITDKQNQSAGAPPQAMTEDAFDRKAKSNKEITADDAREKVMADFKNPQNLFNSAKANYELKKYSEAADDFEKLINDTTTKFYDDAKWFLANCYSRIHKNAKGRKLLKEIANSNSIHKKEAQGLLQEQQ